MVCFVHNILLQFLQYYWRKNRKDVHLMALRFNNEVAELFCQYLWPRRRFNYQELKNFTDFIEERYIQLGCCVIHQFSQSFRSFRMRNHTFPEVGEQEIILAKDGTVRFTKSTFTKGMRVVHKVPSKDSFLIIRWVLSPTQFNWVGFIFSNLFYY